ncbi:MAG TPA: DUF5060 domain-containing protein [Lachnospiraceae bacterium]|nr:DUF5060 domain-containing protein [Lachnospiraceae bacterium]
MTEQYKIFETALQGADVGNPYTDIWLKAAFTDGADTVEVNGFYCGNGNYRVRFMPRRPGIWTAVTKSNDPQLNGIELRCECVPAGENNHGRVLPMNEVRPQSTVTLEDKFHFAYEDGTRFQPFGTTCYAWINQSREVQEETLETLKKAPFNKIRMCIFPKFYTYNTANPGSYAFEGNEADGFDFTRFNQGFWDNLEKRIAQLDELGIEADIILLHPYDKWGFSKMDRDTDVFYLRYAVDRLCHFKNVWWSLANEFDLMPWKTVEDWELYARVVMGRDSYGHLRSIHNCVALYDHTRPWITHVSIQRMDVYKTAENVNDWRRQYQKPIVVDECAYEGNINFGWGNITGEEMTRRFWEGCIRGGYLSHGEVYVQYDQIWWSHGGRLHGTCPERIAFLREVMADVPEGAAPLKLTAQNHEANWDVPCLCREDDNSYFLYYFGFFKPAFRTYELPEGCAYEIELLDTWDMAVTKLPGTYSGNIRVELPEKQYMAIRMKKA